ncbi:MAG: tetratricopeptide repeat protein [Verrucomicrobiales bacterium]|nr:tetratricopeptide repeat protein [Verrucomicrobiales bacterium]
MDLRRIVFAPLALGLGHSVAFGAATLRESSLEITFAKDIAPIIFQNCAWCHRPGQSAPFSLLSYRDVQKRAKQIAEVTARRAMPPWLPEPGYGEFANDPRLTAEEIERIQRWVSQGTAEGRAKDLPRLPDWREEWQLGQPDLIVQAPQAYQLSADGKDVYRNLVIPIPTGSTRYVKGVEFKPGNPKVVHHAFVNIDSTRQSRRLAEKEKPNGFAGMELPETAHMPGGQLLGWQPGKVASFSPPGLSWVLEKNTDLVLQLHLHPSGKPEQVQPQVGVFFTDQAPTNVAYRIRLESFKMDIPAGVSDYSVEQSYVLPVDVTILRILPHAHYLGKEMRVYATLPDGMRKWLIYIPNWDFNWQRDYAYKTPIHLPKGTKLEMKFSYDNSTANPRNPHNPPKRVKFGLESTDEMAACSLQALPRNTEDRRKLAEDFHLHYARTSLDYNKYLLEREPTNAVAHTKAARALLALGDIAQAQQHLGNAIRARPDFDKAYYDLGAIWLQQNRLTEAEKAFKAVIHFNPTDYQAYGSLGIIYLRQGRIDEAEAHLRSALRLNPDDQISERNLSAISAARAAKQKK